MFLRTLFAGTVLALWAGSVSAITLPPDFVRERVTPNATFDTPTGMAFLPDGRILVAEKRGRVYIIENGVKRSTPLWSRESEVLNVNDRGLLDVAVDPNYSTNRYIYLLYTVDPDSNGVDQGVAFGRLTRYQVSASDPNELVSSSRTILMGVTWSEGPCSGSGSHTIGSLRWGSDGSLLVSAGEGAEYVDDAGGQHPDMFLPGRTDPYEDIGAFRAQYLGSLAGKILRINPSNGLGYTSNPYYDGNGASPQSKVWAYGLRNPFRFSVKPGTGRSNPAQGDPGVLFVGDVGSNTWEELNVVTDPGQNFGWPCYEGPAEGYLHDANPDHHGCGTLGEPENPAMPTSSVINWHHWNPDVGSPPGMTGNSAVAGAFYTGTQYPSQYRDRCFFFDYGTSVIKMLETDSNYDLVGVQGFATDAGGPVDIVADPVSRDLFYVSIYDGLVYRIRYTGEVSNNNPVAVANGTPLAGPTPLTVSFSSAGSFDPDDDPITTTWLFDDLSSSTEADPQHTFYDAGVYQVVLTVEDNGGGIGRDTLIVNATGTPSGFPSTGVLDSFNRPDGPVTDPWTGNTAGLAIESNTLSLSSTDGWAVWTGATFGPWQEVYFTLSDATANAPEHDLMLKVQGESWADGEIEVRYDAEQNHVRISTYDAVGGWQHHGSVIPLTLGIGDQLGARADANGSVQVYLNGALVGGASVDSWPFYAQGGRVGVTLVGDLPLRVDNFGGGDVTSEVNTAPQAAILAPTNGGFFAAGDTIQLDGDATDAEQQPDSLLYHWRVDVHHNTHVHPSSYVADTRDASFIADNHDDGTGIHYEIHLDVTDGGGLQDTETIVMWPDTDLEPSRLEVSPESPSSGASAQYSFTIHNHGRMLAPSSHWTLMGDATELASGDTIVDEQDSVRVTVTVPPMLSEGVHELRVTVDTLGAVHETDEDNNVLTRSVTVIASVLASEGGRIGGVALSRAYPNPSTGPIGLSLALPRPSRVEFTIHDLQGREIWSEPSRERDAGSWTLRWNAETSTGHRARPGVYLARVVVDGHVLTRRLALMR